MRENFKTQALALLLSSVVMSGAFAMAPEDRDDRDGSSPAKVGPGTLTLNTPGTINNDGTLTLPNGATVTFTNGGTLTFAGTNVTLTEPIAGTGGITPMGVGTLTFTGFMGSRNQPSTAAR